MAKKIKGVLWLGNGEAFITVYENHYMNPHGMYSVDHRFPGPLGTTVGGKIAPPVSDLKDHEFIYKYKINGHDWLLILKGLGGVNDSFLDRISTDLKVEVEKLKIEVNSAWDIVKHISSIITKYPDEVLLQEFNKGQVKQMKLFSNLVSPPQEPRKTEVLTLEKQKPKKV